jgi:transcription factor-like protein
MTTTFHTAFITDAGRQALLYTLSQASGFGHTGRTYTATSLSPISSGYASRQIPSISLPTTTDLQRYINAYVQYFHPHMPFLHIPTLNFDAPTFTNNVRRHHSFSGGTVGGGGCLILAMAAIGASYEFEHDVAMELFEASKKMLHCYLEERLKAPASHHNESTPTPLWIVQAMLLNVIFGHQCGDQKACEIASTHCAALISLARSAGLFQHPNQATIDEELRHANSFLSNEDSQADREAYFQWYAWKCIEERKRTLYSVFVVSSLLVIGYNHQPKILNSELALDLPCEEDLWASASPAAWHALGGAAASQEKAIPFKQALEFLLTASGRLTQGQRPLSQQFEHQVTGSSVPLESLPASELKPSTFGCYVLLNALHVYIWETRQRHQGQSWKAHETEQLHAHIEPALREWQAAWRANPHHGLERPNPYGPLPADCIPLLDLAYVRLFVNLGRSKDMFWLHDFEGMAHELSSGFELTQHAEIIAHLVPNMHNTTTNDPTANSNDTSMPPPIITSSLVHYPITVDISLSADSPNPPPAIDPLKRERILRRAAFYAADSLSMADKLGATYAHFTSRELPMQAAMCTYDCTQVVAEWIATMQDRIGPVLGCVLGSSGDGVGQAREVGLVEDADVELFEKVREVVGSYEVKMGAEVGDEDGGMGNRLLMLTACLLDKAAVWGSKF